MSDLNTEIKITASADGVETGVARAKRSLADLGATAAKAGSDGGKGMAPIGDGAEAAARKVASATRSMQNSLQRQIAALEAGGTATRQYQESLAKLRGVDANAIKPLLDQLDAAKRKADGAGQGLLGLGSASSLLQGQLAALAGSLTLGSMAAFVLQINNGIDALNDIKDATGATIENISALEDVGKRTGASLDLVGGILIKFNDVLSKAGPKSDIALQLQAIGLSAEELKRLDPAEALLKTAKALQQYADDGNKARLVQDLFGKSVKDAAPFLNDLAEKGALVAKVTSQQAEEADKFNKQLFEMRANFDQFSRSGVLVVIESINGIAQSFREAKEAGDGFFGTAWRVFNNDMRQYRGAPRMPVKNYGQVSTGVITYDPGYTPTPTTGDNRPSVALGPTASEVAAAEAERRAAAQRAATDRQRELAEQAKFYADLSGLSADYYDKLARAQKERAAGNISEGQYVEYVEQLIQKQPFATALTRDNAAALKAQATASIEAAKASASYYGAIGQDLSRLDEQNERLRQEGEQIGLTAAGLLALTLARQNHAIAIESERLSLLQANEGSTEEIILQQRRIALLKEQRTLTATNGQRQIAAESAKDVAAEWKKASEQIEQSLTDALMRGFESGKGFAETFRDTLVNMFKTLVLRPVISAVVNPVAGAITGGLGLSGTANAATGGSNALSALSSLASVSSSFGAGGAAGFGALIGGGFTEAVSAGFTTLFTGGSVGTAAAGLGTLAGALGPIALGLAALSSLIGKTGGESRSGGQYGYSFDGTLVNNRRGTEVQGAVLGVNRLEGAANFAESEVQAAIAGTVGSINALLASAGSSAALVGFQAGLETSGKGRGGVFAGGTLSTGVAFGESGRGDNYAGTLFETTSTQSPDAETALKNFALDLQQATVQALQAAADIPEALKKLVQGVDAEALTADAAAALLNTVQAQISAVEQLNAAFGSIGWDSFGQGAYNATVALAEASGGFDALAQNLVGYYANFYTQAEQQARATETLTAQLAALGQTLPTTRDGFRALVESAKAAGNTTLLAGLMALQDEFAALVPATRAAAAAVSALTADVAELYDSVYAEYTESVRSARGIADEQAALAQQMAQVFAGAMGDAQAYVTNVAGNIRQYLDGLSAQAGGGQGYNSAAAAFSSQLTLARGGDRDALDGITQYADRLLGAIKAESSSSAEAALRTGRLRGQLAALPSQISPEQFIIQAVAQAGQQTVAAIDALASNALTTELTVTARSEILKTIRYIADTDKLPDDLKQLALDTTSSLRKTVSYVVGSELPEDVKQLALQGSTDITKTIRLVAESTLTPDLQALALQTTGSVSKTIDLIARSAISPDLQILALQQNSAARKLIEIAATSTMPDDLRALALQLSGTATKTLQLIATSTLTDEQAQLALTGNSLASKTILLAASSTLTEDQKRLVFFASEAVQKTIGLVATSTLTPDLQTLALQATGSVSKTIALSANNLLDATDQRLALTAAGSITRSIDLAMGRADGTALSILGAQSDLVRRTIEASGGTLTDDQRALLTTTDSITKLIELGVDRTQLDSLFAALRSLPPITIPFVGTFNVGSVLEHSANGGNANLDRLASINAYVNTLDFAGNKIAATQALYQTALAYGVNQADIAAATGYAIGDIRALFDAAGIPAFAVGTNYVPRDTLAYLHEGEAVVPKAYNPAANGGTARDNNAGLIAEIRAMRQENDAQARAMVQLQQRLVRLSERWDAQGMPETRVEA